MTEKTGTEIAMSLAPTRGEALAEKIERSQFGLGLSSEEIAMVVMALRQSARPEALEKDADLLATIEKLVREGGKRYPCFDEDEFLAAVRSRFALSPQEPK